LERATPRLRPPSERWGARPTLRVEARRLVRRRGDAGVRNGQRRRRRRGATGAHGLGVLLRRLLRGGRRLGFLGGFFSAAARGRRRAALVPPAPSSLPRSARARAPRGWRDGCRRRGGVVRRCDVAGELGRHHGQLMPSDRLGQGSAGLAEGLFRAGRHWQTAVCESANNPCLEPEAS
jgi:hypothetical protein